MLMHKQPTLYLNYPDDINYREKKDSQAKYELGEDIAHRLSVSLHDTESPLNYNFIC